MFFCTAAHHVLQPFLFLQRADGIKAFFQVRKDVINMFCANGQADRIRADALVEEFLLRELGMGSGRRMDHKALDIRHIGQK